LLRFLPTLLFMFSFDCFRSRIVVSNGVGDLHPGNILVSRDKSVSGHPLRLHLLDCGLVVEMGPEQHVNLVKILGAFARRNGRLAGQLMVDTSSDCQASDIDIELFVKGIEHIVVDDENNNFLEKVGDYITDICFLACQRKVKLEASFINAALAVEIMEGIATSLYPDLKVTKIALPLVVQAELMHRLPKLSLW
jgi:aarF domain-containing kinase